MVQIVNVDLFMNGALLSESVDGLPERAVVAFVKRLMLNLMEPNSSSEHVCNENCKIYAEIIIGSVDNLPCFEDCIPRSVKISIRRLI